MSKKGSITGSFGYATEGIMSAFKTEPNFRIHIIVGVISMIAAYILKFTKPEWIILIFNISLVLILELINTAIETIVNIISPNYSRRAKIIKDVSAGAVMIAAISAVVIGVILFLPKLLPH